jgi:hypothetical protein
MVKKKYGYARDIHCARLIESTGKAFDRNAFAIADRADSSSSSFSSVDYIRCFMLYR